MTTSKTKSIELTPRERAVLRALLREALTENKLDELNQQAAQITLDKLLKSVNTGKQGND